MSGNTQAALDIVQREEENNAMEANTAADQAAAGGDYNGANRAANDADDAYNNATNLEEANR